MAPVAAEVEQALLALNPKDRALVIEHGLASLEADEHGNVSPAWLAEIGSRVDDILAGRVELVDADETYRLLSAELAAS
jgi:hypothetical protein